MGLLIGPVVAALGVLAVFIVVRGRARQRSSLYSTRRALLSDRVQERRDRALGLTTAPAEPEPPADEPGGAAPPPAPGPPATPAWDRSPLPPVAPPPVPPSATSPEPPEPVHQPPAPAGAAEWPPTPPVDPATISPGEPLAAAPVAPRSPEAGAPSWAVPPAGEPVSSEPPGTAGPSAPEPEAAAPSAAPSAAPADPAWTVLPHQRHREDAETSFDTGAASGDPRLAMTIVSYAGLVGALVLVLLGVLMMLATTH